MTNLEIRDEIAGMLNGLNLRRAVAVIDTPVGVVVKLGKVYAHADWVLTALDACEHRAEARSVFMSCATSLNELMQRPYLGCPLWLLEALYRSDRDAWLRHQDVGTQNNLYLRERLKEDLPGYVLAKSDDLAGEFRGFVSEAMTEEAARVGGEIRYLHSTQGPCVAVRFPPQFAGTPRGRWAVRAWPW